MKQYIGDSVYLELERGMLKLTTDNGFGPDNTIYLEPEVYNNLVTFVQGAVAVSVHDISPQFVWQRPQGEGPGE